MMFGRRAGVTSEALGLDSDDTHEAVQKIAHAATRRRASTR